MEDFGRWLSSLPSAWKQDCAEPLFAAAYQCYQSPGRVYHAWSHVVDCVEKLRSFPCESGRRVFLSLLFHDAVYVPGNSRNEDESAELAARMIRQHSSIGEIERGEISRFILATKHHRLPPGERDLDLQVTIDIDMSILGASPEAYRAYAEGVRREYCPAVTSKALFIAGRADFLSKVLAQPQIFHTPEAVARWEDAARRNIADELHALGAEQGMLSRLAGWTLRWRKGDR